MCAIQSLHKWKRLERSGQGWQHHRQTNCQQCSESLHNKTVTSVLGNNRQRLQFSSILASSTGHSCVPEVVLLWFDFGFLKTAVTSR